MEMTDILDAFSSETDENTLEQLRRLRSDPGTGFDEVLAELSGRLRRAREIKESAKAYERALLTMQHNWKSNTHSSIVYYGRHAEGCAPVELACSCAFSQSKHSFQRGREAIDKALSLPSVIGEKDVP